MFHPPHPEAYRDQLRAFLREDWGTQDWTTAAVPDRPMTARVVAKGDLVLAGLPMAVETFRLTCPNLNADLARNDGQRVGPGTEVMRLRGSSHGILLAERVMLNLLQRLSGTATLTRKFVEAVEGTGARILDTRKTTPGLKLLEKYAVRCGGGVNLRFNLGDGVLLKENHLAAAGGVRAAVEAARRAAPNLLKIEVEVDTLEQLQSALKEQVDAVLLDNMPLNVLAEAVRITDKKAITEASGGITPQTAEAIVSTGVDLLSIGWITHSAPALDLSLDCAFEL